MKRFIVILLLVCLGLPFLGTYGLFLVRQQRIRAEVRATIDRGIDTKDLTIFRFRSLEMHTVLHWKHDKEFEFNGHLYDVVEKKCSNDSVTLFCWKDYAESGLKEMLTGLVNKALGQDRQNRDNQERLARYFKSLFTKDISDPILQPDDCCVISFSGSAGNWYSNVYISPPVPPPKMNVCRV